MAKLINGCGKTIDATIEVLNNTIVIKTLNSPGMVIDFTNVLYLDMKRGNVLPFKPPG